MTSSAICSSRLAVGAVADRVLVDRRGIDRAHRCLEFGIALLRRALVGAENAVILAGEGVAEAVFEDRGGADDDRRLAEVFEHRAELLLDRGHEFAVQQLFADLRRDGEIVLDVDHLRAQTPRVVLDEIGIEHVRADEIGIVRLDAAGKELGVGGPEHAARQQHADGLAADAARADLALFDGDEVGGRKVLAAEGKALRLVAEQAADDVVAVCERLGGGLLGLVLAGKVEHAVPAVAPLAGLGEDVKDAVALGAGGDKGAVRALDLHREVHILGLAAVDLDGVDIGRGVHRADVQEHGRGMADARDRLVNVLFVQDRHIGDRLLLLQEGAGQTEEVA